jgi:hypothetical protein
LVKPSRSPDCGHEDFLRNAEDPSFWVAFAFFLLIPLVDLRLSPLSEPSRIHVNQMRLRVAPCEQSLEAMCLACILVMPEQQGSVITIETGSGNSASHCGHTLRLRPIATISGLASTASPEGVIIPAATQAAEPSPRLLAAS